MLRVIVVDDEAPARRYLRRLIEAHGDVHIVGEAATQEQALALIQAQAPQAIFLDIELTHGTGFDLLRGLDPAPAVVFVTAHADHAARAFDVEALDYLLKPVSAQRLDKTLARLRLAQSAEPAAPAYLIARNKHETRPIKVDMLSAVLAQGDYARLCCADGTTELIHNTLTRLRPQLPSPPFFQASRSLIINLDHVAKISNNGKRCVEFTRNAAPVELGLTAYERLRRELAAGARQAPARVPGT